MQKQDTRINEEPSTKYQYFAAFVVNLLMMGYGVTCGWSSPAIILLTSDESPLPSGKITMDQASYIAALTNCGGLIGNLFFGYITSKFGRRMPLLTLVIPTILSWMLILFGQNVYYLYAARIINGFVGGSIFILIPIFLSEIGSDRVRGILGSLFVLTFNMGVLIVFTMGNYCDYYSIPKFVICITILFGILFPFFPETPLFLVKQNKISAAENSIRFYKNLRRRNENPHLVDTEINKLRNALNGTKTDKNNENSLKWADFITRPARKALLIGIVLIIINQFSGCVAMLNYTAFIFQEAGSHLSPNMSAIIVGIIELLGSIIATNLVDRAGRKFLWFVSTIGTALGLISMGIYTMLKSQHYNVEPFNWIPIAGFSFIIFIASFAILNLPFLVISEIMPEKLKAFGVSSCMILCNFLSFCVVKFLPSMIDTFGFHISMFLFAGICIMGTVFIVIFVPETKGKSYEQIMNLLQ